MATEISSAEFISHFSFPDEHVFIENLVVIGEVEFDSSNFKCQSAKVKNVTFQSFVSFYGVDLGVGIIFTDSIFKKSLNIYGSNASGTILKFSWKSVSVVIDNCKIATLNLDEGNDFEFGLEIINDSIIGNLSISELDFKKAGVFIENSTIEKKLDILQSFLGSGRVRFHNSKINCKVRLSSLVLGGITFTSSTFEKDVHIWGGDSSSGISFNDNQFNDDVYIKGMKSVGSLTISGDNFKKSIKIDIDDPTNNKQGNFDGVFIVSGNFGIGLTLNGSVNSIKSLFISASQNLIGTLQFNGCSFKDARVQGDNHKASIVFNHCVFQKLTFTSFINFGNLILSSSKAISETDSELIIKNSNLGKSQLFNFYLNSFKKISITDSQISEIITSGVTWFSYEQLFVPADENQNFYKKKREVFRQFKQALEKQGDKIHALEFQAEELKTFERQVSAEKRFWNQNRIILWLGKTNDFGLNWVKPIWLILAITIIFYFFIIISSSNNLIFKPATTLNELLFTIEEFKRYGYLIPQLLNPARYLDRILDSEKDITLGFWTYFLDTFHKIILAFFIFQIISAFRKYVKH